MEDKKTMKNYVIISSTGTAAATTKKAAMALLKDARKNDAAARLEVQEVPAPRFIESMRYYYKRYLETPYHSIYDAYGRPSARKVSSYEYLKSIALYNECRVISKNCMKYTAAMLWQEPETGEILFRVDTAENVKTISLSYVEN